MPHPLVDFHCHLDLYDNFADAVIEAERTGVYTLAVTTTPRAWPRNRELTASLRYVKPALGLHPEIVGDGTRSELALWEKYLPDTRYIGEVGLDAGRQSWRNFDEQKRAFEHILRCCAEAGDKILSVHAVRSVKTVLDMIEAHLPPDRGRVVMHWFSGSPGQAKRAADLGCFFSVNLPMLASERGRLLVAGLPPERILTETDGPFTQLGNRPSKPGDVDEHVRALGEVMRLTADATAMRVAATFKNLLSGKQLSGS